MPTNDTSGRSSPLPQEIDPHEDVELATAQISKNFNTFECVYVAVKVADPYAELAVVFGEVFRHALRQSGDEDALVTCNTRTDLTEQVVDLMLRWANVQLGIEEPRRTNHLFHDDTAGVFDLPISWRRTHVNDLADTLLPFGKTQRSIVERARHAKPMLDQRLFA